MRTQPEGPPDATHGGLTQARPRCQRATAPVRCSLGSLFQGEAYGPLDTVIADLPWRSRPHLVTQTNHPLGDKTIPPHSHSETCHLHFTPTHSSWINQVERWFALLSQRQIKRGSHYSVRELEAAISEFITVHNEQPKPFVWTKSADAILNSIGRFASRTLAVHGTTNMSEINDSRD